MQATLMRVIILSLCVMRAMPIRTYNGESGRKQMMISFKKNRVHYLQEALGLGIFMISACLFSALLFSEKSPWFNLVHDVTNKNIAMGILMGATALFIFYSPWTSPSGSHINPAVTLTFLRLDKMCRYDALFFVIFQVLGGTIAVYLMQLLLGTILTAQPVNSAVTVPGKSGVWPAVVAELVIAFITMSMVLFTSQHRKLKKYTRVFSACLVCLWVIFAGPISGFGMNPARSFASAFPSDTWTAFWIYLITPFAGMLLAAEVFLFAQKKKAGPDKRKFVRTISKTKELMEPLEFLL